MIRLLVLAMAMAMAIAVAAMATTSTTGPKPAQFILSSACPPGFEKTGVGACELRTLYQFYPAKRGLGGTRTALPPHRDGFTPHQIAAQFDDIDKNWGEGALAELFHGAARNPAR